MCDGPDLFLCALSILFPPLGVWVKRGICSLDSFINILLCFLGFLPGLIHAWYIISCNPHYADSYDRLSTDDARVHVYYIQGPPPSAGPGPGSHSTPTGHYGTMAPGVSPAAAAANAKKTPAPPPAAAAAGPSSSSGSSGGAAATAAAPAIDGGSGGAGTKASAQGEEVGPNEPPPPSYTDAVKGDHKIQSP